MWRVYLQKINKLYGLKNQQCCIILLLCTMYADFYEVRNLQPLILYFLTLILGVVFYFPMHEVQNFHRAHESTLKLTERMMMAKQNIDMDIKLEQLLSVFDETPYSGIWVNDMKQSKLLEQDNGTIQIRTHRKQSSDPSAGFDLLINIFDGHYRDSGHFQLKIESSFIRSQLTFTGNQFIFQAKTHLIGQYQSTHIFFQDSPQTLYIEKLKFRVSQDKNNLMIELLIGAQNDFNIISKKMVTSHGFYTQLFLTLFVLAQISIQFLGVYYLIEQLQTCDTFCKSLSSVMMEYIIGFDLAQLGAMIFLFFTKSGLTMFSLPIALLFYKIFWYQISVLQTINPVDNSQNQEGASFRKSLTHYNRCLLKGLCTFFLFYLNNMHHYLFIVFYALFLFPQIHQNFQRGLKITYDLKWLMMFTLPRLLVIVPLRVITGAFVLQRCYLFALFCLVLVMFQVSLLYLQKIYGSRSILPKFLTPKGFSQFKFFMNQDENHICYQCQDELKSIPSTLHQSQSILSSNKIVVTPCNHKFHLPCLIEWMEISQKCPVCSSTLPPIDQEDQGAE